MKLDIVKVDKNVEECVFNLLKRLDYKPKKSKVFIKPNIVRHHSPNSPIITNPRIVAGIIDYLKSLGIKDIYVGDGSTNPDIRQVYRISGYESLARKKGVKLVNMYDCETKEVKYKFGKIRIPKIAFESEYINVAKLKTHGKTTVTFCIKNQKGLLPLSQKKIFHKNLHESIAELYKAIKPDFSVIDGLNGIEGGRPGSGGKFVNGINLIIAGYDAFEVDCFACKLIGQDPKEVRYLTLISKPPMFSEDLIKKLEMHRLNFQKPADDIKARLSFRLVNEVFLDFNIYYWQTEETCSGCSTLLTDIKRSILKNPIYFIKLLPYLFKRLDILTGKSEVPKNHDKVLCLGICTKKYAKKHNFVHVEGCPPSPKKITEKM